MNVSHYELLNNPNDTTAITHSLGLEKNYRIEAGGGGSWCGKVVVAVVVVVVVIVIFIIIIEFFTSQLSLGNIHLSWDVVINRIRLGGRICSLKSFLQLNMCQELQIFAVVYMYSDAS